MLQSFYCEGCQNLELYSILITHVRHTIHYSERIAWEKVFTPQRHPCVVIILPGSLTILWTPIPCSASLPEACVPVFFQTAKSIVPKPVGQDGVQCGFHECGLIRWSKVCSGLHIHFVSSISSLQGDEECKYCRITHADVRKALGSKFVKAFGSKYGRQTDG